MRQVKGFTLIELMIAILIFAMISTAAYKLFDSVSRAQQVTDGILDHLDEIQRALVVLEKDLFQVAPRPIRDEFGDRQKAIVAPGTNGEILEFTRFGWRNPLLEVRSNMQRVAYSLEEGELVRYYWPMLDRAPDPVQVRQVLLTDVHGVRLKLMDEKKRWLKTWPPQGGLSYPQVSVPQPEVGIPGQQGQQQGEQYTQMPHAIELTVQHKAFGTLTTVLPLLTYKPSDSQRLKPEQEKAVEEGQKKNPRADSTPDSGLDDDE